MKNDQLVKKLLTIFMVLMNLALSVSVVFIMGHVQNLLNSDVKINLTEIVTQNKDAITSRLMMSMNSLDITANKITESLKNSQQTQKIDPQELLIAYAKKNNTNSLFVANKDGLVLLPDNKSIDISGRNYFRLAMSGIPNISDKVISRLDGVEIFAINVPLRYEKQIIGTIQKIYTQKELYDLCSLSLFSSQGYMFIINSEGYILLHSVHADCDQKSDNYFRDIFASGNPEASEQIKMNLQKNHGGFVETKIGSKEIFSAYTPIEKIHDWSLITSVPTSAVSPNGATVIKLFYVILFVMVFIFTSSLTYFLWYKNKQRVHLETIAFVDTVTGGNTYTKFLVDVKKIFENNPEKQFYIMAFDIDNFKFINNYYGFDFGDTMLRHINTNMACQLRSLETIARISSDHFIVLLKDVLPERINALLSSVENENVIIYLSAGIYAVDNKEESISLMLDKASTAAESIKGMLNKKVVHYSSKFEQLTIQNEHLKRAVRQAIENNEFIPYYQPKVNIIDGELTGAEALVRWKTREGKFVYPNEFIPMCEQTGVIVEIDMIMYESVLVFLKSFLDQGLPCVPISVNFSRLHLLDDTFFDKIVKMQKDYGIPAHLIELELTESAIFDNVEGIYEFTQKMHTNGFLIAMDDFGSGYSSLNMLKDIPIDILKIDKAFLSETTDNNRRNIIFATITEMARKLNIKVVVEGVEHLDDVELMKECGCFIAQGYYFAKPMDEQSFEKIFRKGEIC